MARARATTSRESGSEVLSGPLRVLRGMRWMPNGTQVGVTCPSGHEASYRALKTGGGRVTCGCGFESDVELDGLEG